MEWEDLSIFVTQTRVGWQCGSCWGLSLMRSQVPSSKFLVWNLVRLIEPSNWCNRCVCEWIRDKCVKVALNKKLLKKAALCVSDSTRSRLSASWKSVCVLLFFVKFLSHLLLCMVLIWKFFQAGLTWFCPLQRGKIISSNFPTVFLGVCLDMPAAFSFSFLC